MTISAVAAEANVSKGGLFYHFASKEALVDALVSRYVGSFDVLIGLADDRPGAATLAYLESAARREAPASHPVVALLTAAMMSPVALESLRERYRAWQARLDDDQIPAHLAATVRFAVDGMWLADVLDLAPVPEPIRRDVIAELRRTVERAERA